MAEGDASTSMRLLAIFLLLAGLACARGRRHPAQGGGRQESELGLRGRFHDPRRDRSGDKPVERDASYSMIASGKDRTLILMRSPSNFYGALVLMADDRCWMLLPRATKPWELSAAQMLAGDIATGDLARSNLTKGYAATLAGEDAVGRRAVLAAGARRCDRPRALRTDRLLDREEELPPQKARALRTHRQAGQGRRLRRLPEGRARTAPHAAPDRKPRRVEGSEHTDLHPSPQDPARPVVVHRGRDGADQGRGARRASRGLRKRTPAWSSILRAAGR